MASLDLATLPETDWALLARLRTGFLHDPSKAGDYWHSARALELYDISFAERIGWKWDAVIRELHLRRWSPPPPTRLIDFGCRTGVATRRWLEAFPSAAPTEVLLVDRSNTASTFARERVLETHPALRVDTASSIDPARIHGAVVLLSHVLNELPGAVLEPLLLQLRCAAAIVWVESGQQTVARPLVELRERLIGSFRVVAPCTHQAACGLTSPQNQAHWCHHFARPRGRGGA